MSVFVDDPRVRIQWTIAPGSEYAAATDEYLARLGVRLTSWEQACARSYALIIATSGNGELERLDGPLMLLPHGAGYSRVVAPGQAAPAGLAPSQLIRGGQVVAELVGLEHEDQFARLAVYCPQAESRGVVLGDPTRDRMAVGARLRDIYRSSLDVPDHCALVVVSSTWGAGSLLERHHELPMRLAAALPIDEYRLAAVVHPNAAASMGAWEVGRLLLRSRAAGLRLIPPDRWEGAVLAADLVIGDHGSVALYAAAAGIRVMLGSYDSAQIVSDSPMAALAALLPRLDPDSALEPQVRHSLSDDARGPAYCGAREATGLVGLSLQVTQKEAYRLLGLPCPAAQPQVRAPEPCERAAQQSAAHMVLVERCVHGRAEFCVRRFATGVDPDLVADSTAEEICRHIVAGVGELDMSTRENAEVLLLGPFIPAASNLVRSLKRVLEEESVCATAVGAVTGPDRCLLAVRDYGVLGLRMDHTGLDASVLPSALLAIISQERGEMASVVRRLRATVSVHIGRAEARMGFYEPAEDDASRPF
jgi:hypothetical protein